MQVRMTAKIFGVLLLFFSFSMLTPLIVSYYYHEHNQLPFIIAFIICFGSGIFLWFPNRHCQEELKTRSGFLIVFLTWTLSCCFGAIPFLLSYEPHLPFTRAFFEAVSDLTTVGATTITDLDALPKSILYYRQQLQFLGGMGVVVLAIAVMPLIGLGGMQLFKAETTGPSKETKITPRITETAKALWLIYLGLNIICAFLYWLFGMTPFDAICYAFSTVATGGAAPHDAGIAYYPHISIYLICMIFMLFGGINFTLHYLALYQRDFKVYWRNPESRAYLLWLSLIGILAALILSVHNYAQGNSVQILINSWFQVISFGTTTGYVTDSNFSNWPGIMPLLLVLLGVIGGCSGSTSGGIKIIRVLMVLKQIAREIKQLVHPQGVFTMRLGDQIINPKIAHTVFAFLAAYTGIFVLLWLALSASGIPIAVAFFALASCLSNVGTGLGAVAYNFSSFHGGSLWILASAMLIGRLDIFTVLILLSPVFWRR